MERGIDVDRVMTAQLSLSGHHYDDVARMTRFADTVLERLASAPGIEAASLVNYPPLSSFATSYSIAVDGRPSPPGEEPRALCWIVAPRYFATMGIPLVIGREFEAADARQRPGVAIARRTFAARFWPNGDAVGQQVTVLIPESNAFWIPRAMRRPLTIVGVAENVRIDGVSGPIRGSSAVPPLRPEPDAHPHAGRPSARTAGGGRGGDPRGGARHGSRAAHVRREDARQRPG